MKRILRVFTFSIFLSAMVFSGKVWGAITAVTAQTEVMCYGANTGSLSVNPSGGTAPYTYLWNTGATSQSITGLIAGTYGVTVTDNSGVTAGFTYNISQPSPLFITRTVTGEGCGGQDIGTVTLNITNPTSTYTFHWSNGATTEDLINLPAAVYYVTITDAMGCVTIDSANVVQPPGVGITDTVTEVTCSAGMNNGAIAVGVQFGNPPYTYLWNDGITTESRSNLTIGNYTLTVTDAIGCTATALATVSEQPGSMSINTNQVNPTCFGGNNGTINITSTVGSTGPYTYLWNDGNTSQNRTGLNAGAYAVTATSGTGCTASASVTLTQPVQITVTTHPFEPSCFGGNNGAINTSSSNGSSPYTYAWTGGYPVADITGLTAGNYTVTVTDNKGCTVTSTVALAQPSQIDITATPSQLGCGGGSTASITTTVSGGTGPYSYWWGAGVVTANRTNVSAGTYHVTVTDAKGCTATMSATVAAYTPVSLSVVTEQNYCYGDTFGSVAETAHNGNAPYHYLWNTGDTTSSIGSLSGGNYTVTVTDNNGCTISQTSAIADPPFPIVVNSTISDVSCYGLSNGSIALNPANGHPPYTYKWSGLGTSPTVSGLATGTYTVSINDSWGCTVTATFTVTQPALITPVTTVTNVACFGGNTGAINLAVTGGYSPFTYRWNDGVDSQTRASLYTGTYDVTITDNHACTMTAAATVNQPTQLTSSASGVSPLCFGVNTGTVTASGHGGTSPYNYNWTGGITTQTQTGLPPGNYNVTVTDANGCTSHSGTTLSSPVAINIVATGSNVACNGSNTGTIIINPSGGTSPYTFNWGGGVTTQNLSNLGAGSYTVTVTDNVGCTASNTTVVGQSTNLATTATVTNATCFGSSTGSIITNTTGGTSPYTYNWGGGITTSQRNNLTAGNYAVTVTDHAGCSVSTSSVVGQPALLTVSATTTPATCFNGTGGTVNVTVAGGTGTYTYNWGGGITTPNRTNLAAGNYTLTVTDGADCTVSNTTTVTQPTQVTVTATQTNVSCNAGNNGTIQLTANGGAGNYTFNWDGGIVTANRTNLSSGTYTATVTDGNGCTATHTTTITQPNLLVINPAITNVNCFGQTSGAIALSINGGTGPYTYNWGGVATQNRTGLAAGSYNVTVTDANSCSLSATEVVTQSQQITTAISSITNASCYGAANGGITIHINGGTPAYTYLWSNGSTGQSLANVAAGTYQLSISDANGCTTSTAINVTQPSQITFTPIVTNVTCNGSATGAIATIVNGGNGGFTYQWSNGATTGNVSNLTAGTYTITYKDIQNCSASATVQVTQPTAIALTTTQSNVTCNGGNTGAAAVQATGGTGTYTYNWNNGQTTAQLTQLAPGTYNVTVQDASACSATTSVNVAQTGGAVVGITSTNVTCAGQANGTIQTTVTVVEGSYTLQWNNGATAANLTGLAAGNYTVTVVDANNCNTTASATIIQPTAITLNQTVTNATCFGTETGGIQLTATGGTGAYQYEWSNGSTTQNISNLRAGNYMVTVKDANACSVTCGRSVSQPTQLSLNLNNTDVNCFGGNTGAVTSTATGGTGAFNYTWSSGQTTAGISNVVAGNYTLSVTDAAGCSISSAISVSQPTALGLQTVPTNVACNGAATGGANALATGGVGGYTYSWSDQSTNQQLSQVNAGTYIVTVQDANACSVTGNVIITQPTAITVTTEHTDYACSTVQGSITLTAAGGVAPYTYHWQDGTSTQNRTGLAAGTYQVTVTDQNHCAQTGTATVAQLPAITTALTQTNVTCNGGNNGNIDVTVTGGSRPYSYRWSNSANTSTIQNLTATSYSVVITDAKGCTASTGANITQPAAIQATANIAAVNCFGNTNGAVNVTVAGGVAPLAFAWSNNNTTQNLSNVAAGNYALTITDANHCTAVVQSNVTQPAQLALGDSVTAVGCSGQDDGSATITPAGGTPPYFYSWSNSEKTAAVSGLAAGTYTVTVNDNNDCLANRSVTITSSAPLVVTPSVNNASCKGVNNGTIGLSVSGGTSPYNYSWNNGQTTEQANELGAGNYVVTVTDAKGCSASSGGDIAISYELSVHAAASVTATTGTPVQLTATTNTDHANVYSWTPATLVTCANCANTNATPQQTTLFTVYVVDANGCKADDTVTIQVNTATDVFIPNAFTPNGDGVNDQFKIFGDLSNIYFMEVSVFDRWGEKVFESNDPGFEWDGTYRGEPAPIGVYIYVATAVFNNGSHRDFKGSVTLLR